MSPKNYLRQNTLCLEQQIYAKQENLDTTPGCDGWDIKNIWA